MMVLLAAGAASAQNTANFIPSCPANTVRTCGNVCLGISGSLYNGQISGAMTVQNLNAANTYTIQQALVTVYDANNNIIARVTPSNCVGTNLYPQGGSVACQYAVSVPYSPKYSVGAMVQGGPCYSSAAVGAAQTAAAQSTTATTTVAGGPAPAASGN